MLIVVNWCLHFADVWYRVGHIACTGQDELIEIVGPNEPGSPMGTGTNGGQLGYGNIMGHAKACMQPIYSMSFVTILGQHLAMWLYTAINAAACFILLALLPEYAEHCLWNNMVSVFLCVPREPTAANLLLQVCCYGLGEQEILIDCAAAAGECEQCYVVSICRLLNTGLLLLCLLACRSKWCSDVQPSLRCGWQMMTAGH